MGGRVSVHVPWSLAAIDPHLLSDAAALLFGSALFDTLFAESSGAVSPSLAESMPEEVPGGTQVTLRSGVRFASGTQLTPRDVVASLARARAAGAHAWLADLGTVRAEPAAVVFSGRDPERLARSLASPLAAIVPSGFSPERPDGTGPFALQRDGSTLVLTRNALAAGGPAYLDMLRVTPAPDLATSLREFEGGQDDIGWLGLGLHEPRHGAVAFDAGAVGWALLRTGRAAGRWDLPGVAQRLCDGIDPSRLAHLGVGAAWSPEPSDGWGGPPADLLVDAESSWLVELARALAAALTQPGHEVTVKAVSAAELGAARASRAYALAVDVARPFDASPMGTRLGLATADDPAAAKELALHPPRGPVAARSASRVLRVGVVGELRMAGGRAPDLLMPRPASGLGVDFGAMARARPSVR
jgi:peptide/nickel transport system substrate-binding protein